MKQVAFEQGTVEREAVEKGATVSARREKPAQAPIATALERPARIGLNATLITFGVCAIIMMGWLLQHNVVDWRLDPRTSFATAFCFAILAVVGRNQTLSLQGRPHPLTHASRTCGLAATGGFALFVLSQYLMRSPDAGSPMGTEWGVIAPGTVIVILLITAAMLAFEARRHHIVIWAATLCLVICELALVGHLLDQTAMRETLFFGYMGPLTASLAGLSALAILCVTPGGNWLSEIVEGGRRAALRGRLVAYAIGLPIIAQIIVTWLVSHHALPITIGRSLLTVVVGIALAREILRAARINLQSEALSARLGAIIESSDDAIIGKDLNGRIVSWNHGAERLFGYREKDILGQTMAALIPEDRPDEEHNILSRIQHGKRLKSYETQRVRDDGVKLDVSITMSPIHGSDGTIIGVSSITRDITSLVRTNAQLRRSNEELAQFAHIASHDMREPLRMVANYAELLEEHCGEALDATAKGYLHHVSQGALRMQQMIADLLAYSRVEPQGRPLVPTPVGPIVQRVADLFEEALAECGGDLRWGELPSVEGDHNQLCQVFQNLVGNAIKFRSDRALRIDINASRHGNDWTFRISDNGLGFDAEHADKIFDMFQRLHPRQHFPGSGIGLAIVKRIVERHGGKVWICGHSGQGSEVFFTLKGVR